MSEERSIQSGISVIHKVGNVGIFALLKFENKFDKQINYLN